MNFRAGGLVRLMDRDLLRLRIKIEKLTGDSLRLLCDYFDLAPTSTASEAITKLTERGKWGRGKMSDLIAFLEDISFSKEVIDALKEYDRSVVIPITTVSGLPASATLVKPAAIPVGRDRWRFLFAAANPLIDPRNYVDQVIQNMRYVMGDSRVSWDIQPSTAWDKLLDSIKLDFDLVQFYCENSQKTLSFMDAKITPDQLFAFFGMHHIKNVIKCAVFTVCNSAEFAQRIARDDLPIVATPDELNYKLAWTWSEHFYASLLDGDCIGDACEKAVSFVFARYGSVLNMRVYPDTVAAKAVRLSTLVKAPQSHGAPTSGTVIFNQQNAQFHGPVSQGGTQNITHAPVGGQTLPADPFSILRKNRPIFVQTIGLGKLHISILNKMPSANVMRVHSIITLATNEPEQAANQLLDLVVAQDLWSEFIAALGQDAPSLQRLFLGEK